MQESEWSKSIPLKSKNIIKRMFLLPSHFEKPSMQRSFCFCAIDRQYPVAFDHSNLYG